jgi:hypothetical protein
MMKTNLFNVACFRHSISGWKGAALVASAIFGVARPHPQPLFLLHQCVADVQFFVSYCPSLDKPVLETMLLFGHLDFISMIA